jgi:NAD+ synthetase
LDLARRLGIQILERPIGEAFHILRNELGLPEPDVTNKSAAERAVENLQSRLRGNILMTISNAENRLLLSTGNKSELALGYCTLYGDTNGGLAVIGDVLKTEVYQLARTYNQSTKSSPNRSSPSHRQLNLRPDNSTSSRCRLTKARSDPQTLF